MKNVRTVIWDLDGVVWFHLKEETDILARALGIAEKKEFADEFNDFFKMFMSYFSDKIVSKDGTLKIIEEKMPILYFYGYTPEQFFKVFGRLKFRCNDFNEESLLAMKYLSEKGIKNIVKTDWFLNIQKNMLKNYGLLDYIEELHCCDNSFLKSNPLSAKGIIKSGKEQQYVMLGDSLESDIGFAEHSRIKSIWFNRGGRHNNNTKHNPTFEIHSLLEVTEII